MAPATLLLAAAAALAAAGAASAGAAGPVAKPIARWRALPFEGEGGEAASGEKKGGGGGRASSGCHSCMLGGVKVAVDVATSQSKLLVSVPRWQPGVPATLAEVVPGDGGSDCDSDGPDGLVLRPWPSVAMNRVGEPGALQSVLGFEATAKGEVWILDQGKVAGKAALPGTIKLIIWDVAQDKAVLTHYFSPEVAPLVTSFLNDLVVDEVNGFAYISDTGLNIDPAKPVQPALVVFDRNTNTSWRVLDQTPPVMNTDLWMVVNGSKVFAAAPIVAGADGIAMSPDTHTLYFCPLTSHALYSIPTAALRAAQSMPAGKLKSFVGTVSENKGSASDGLGMSNTGVLYTTALDGDTPGLHAFGNFTRQGGQHPKTESFTNYTAATSPLQVWPDTIGWDHKGSVLWTTNDLPKYMQKTMDYENVWNFHIWSLDVNADSYLFPTKKEE